MTTPTAYERVMPDHVAQCSKCDDTAACDEHLGKLVRCGRCAGTGSFITGMLNGKPVGPGGKCYRCNGKGFHTEADRRRNNSYERHGRRAY